MKDRKIATMVIAITLFASTLLPLTMTNAESPPSIYESEENVKICDDAKNRARQFALELIAMGATEVIYYSTENGFWLVVAVGSTLESAGRKK